MAPTLWVWAINQWGKNSVHNSQYSLWTCKWLVRGIFTFWRTALQTNSSLSGVISRGRSNGVPISSPSSLLNCARIRPPSLFKKIKIGRTWIKWVQNKKLVHIQFYRYLPLYLNTLKPQFLSRVTIQKNYHFNINSHPQKTYLSFIRWLSMKLTSFTKLSHITDYMGHLQCTTNCHHCSLPVISHCPPITLSTPCTLKVINKAYFTSSCFFYRSDLSLVCTSLARSTWEFFFSVYLNQRLK